MTSFKEYLGKAVNSNSEHLNRSLQSHISDWPDNLSSQISVKNNGVGFRIDHPGDIQEQIDSQEYGDIGKPADGSLRRFKDKHKNANYDAAAEAILKYLRNECPEVFG